MDTYKTRLKDITTFIFDVDGVMTNGKIIYTHDGKIDRQFNAKDGYAIKPVSYTHLTLPTNREV